MINLKNYSKIRFLFSFVFSIFLIYAFSQIIINYITSDLSLDIQFSICNPCKTQFQIFKEYLEPFLLLTGIILFTLNRKLTDYISFAIFVFLLGIFLVETNIWECVKSEDFVSCAKSSIIVFLFLVSPLIFLLVNFMKNIGK